MNSIMTVKEFCDKFSACSDGRKWALSTGAKDMDELWLRSDFRHDWRMWIATRTGVLSDKQARLFACWCCRQIWPLLTDNRGRNAVVVAERFANGKATESELDAARAAAWAAARAAAGAAARAAARDAARAAAWAAAWDAQDRYLIEHTSPDFTKKG